MPSQHRMQRLFMLLLPLSASTLCPEMCSFGNCPLPACSASCCKKAMANKTKTLAEMCKLYTVSARLLLRQEPSDLSGGPPLQFERREELARVAQRRGFTRGAELGVRTGDFAVVNLANWPSATDYLLVDLWEAQENYHDASNYGSEQQNKNLQITLRKTRPFKRTARVCRNYTSACVLTEADSYFDFIYVDARHDYLGVKEDLESWWPKLRPGGIFAGHDYLYQGQMPCKTNQDWAVNYDGTRCAWCRAGVCTRAQSSSQRRHWADQVAFMGYR